MVYICEIRYIYDISSATILNQLSKIMQLWSQSNHLRKQELKMSSFYANKLDKLVPNIVYIRDGFALSVTHLTERKNN